MDDDISHQLIDFLTHPDNPWSIIVSSRNPYWIKKCTRVITMQQGTILKDIKN
jgi:ABC-type bacteriocin/lantibiotic exporter with double-glycine peptidase domain